MFDSLISDAGFSKTYPPVAPLELLTNLLFFNFKNICSKYAREIFCLKDISVKLIGFSLHLMLSLPSPLLHIYLY